MKPLISISVTTVVKILNVVESHAALEALNKKFHPDCAIRFADDNEDDADGYSFTFVGKKNIDLPPFQKTVIRIITAAVEKEKKAEAKAEAKAKKTMAGWNGTCLLPVLSKYAKMMDAVIQDQDAQTIDYISDDDFAMAERTWRDTQDLLTLRDLLDTKSREEAYRHARGMDTYVREIIPEKVYDYLCGE